jgi:ligand-binding sensor domain-containing protein
MNQFKLFSFIFIAVISGLFYSCKKEDNPAETKEFVFPSKIINKIVVCPAGEKWFATPQGVFSYNGIKWTSYSDDKNLITGAISDFVFEGLAGINKLWLGTKVGVSSIEIGSSSMSVANYNKGNAEILDNDVSALGIDAQNVKYIGTSKGLSILKGSNWDEFFGRAGEEILSEHKITSVTSSKSGYIYAATEGGGVSKFKYTDAISGETTIDKEWSGLLSDTIYAVFTDNIAQWYGTSKGVAYHSSEYTKRDWKTYTREEGLLCDTVYAIAKDLSGNIWFGTHKGVSKLSGESWQTYTTVNGLVANKVNTIAVDVDGSLWFGTDQGISHFKNNLWEKF